MQLARLKCHASCLSVSTFLSQTDFFALTIFDNPFVVDHCPLIFGVHLLHEHPEVGVRGDSFSLGGAVLHQRPPAAADGGDEAALGLLLHHQPSHLLGLRQFLSDKTSRCQFKEDQPLLKLEPRRGRQEE